MTERTDHVAEAREWAHYAKTSSGESALLAAQISNAEATLALVEQQRIANLIALGDEREIKGSDGGTAAIRIWDQIGHGFPRLHPEIAAAIGLPVEEEN